MSRIGIVATVLLNIVACQFVYVNCVAVYAAREKLWRVSLHTEQSLAPPAMALAQLTGFNARAVLASDPAQLEELARNKAKSIPANQASFNNWATFPASTFESAGVDDAGDFNYVTFNATYHNLTTFDDLDLAYKYFRKSSLQYFASVFYQLS